MWGILNWRGRSSSREYLYTLASCFGAALALIFTYPAWHIPYVAGAVAAGLIALSTIAVTRRVHDGNDSARIVAGLVGLYLTALALSVAARLWAIPLVLLTYGGVVAYPLILFLGFIQPTPGPNRYGPAPRRIPSLRTKPRSVLGDLSDEGAKIHRRMRRNARPSLIMTTGDAYSFSKLGGAPDLDASIAWPQSRDGEDLTFIGQFDLAQARACGGPDWLPDDGVLYAFALAKGWDVGGWTIVHAGAPASPKPTPPTVFQFGERRVRFELTRSLPSLDWLGISSQDLEGEDSEILVGLEDAGAEGSNHRLGGYPSELQQSHMALICERGMLGLGDDLPWEKSRRRQQLAARSWRLLLQIDADPDLEMQWGNGGRLYFFIREADAKAGDFSNTWAVWQTT